MSPSCPFGSSGWATGNRFGSGCKVSRSVRQKVGWNIQAVQWRWPVGLPLVDGFGKGLYEVRTSVDDDIYRVLFCNIQHAMVLLHGFMKKTQKTPKADLDLARKRQKMAKEALS